MHVNSRSDRMLSLDAFRGFDIASMFLVNMTWNEAIFPRQLFHVPWNDPRQGATFTDLVFPWFIFIAGGAIPFSVQSMIRRGVTRQSIIARAARRAVILYLLGVLLTVAGGATTTPLQWTDLFKWNILQLIGAVYFVVVGLWLLPSWCRWGFVFIALVAKWTLMTWLPWDFVNQLIATRALPDAPLGPGTWAHFDAIKRVVNLEHLPPTLFRHLLGWFGMSQQVVPLAAVAMLGALTSVTLNAERSMRNAIRVMGLGTLAIGLGLWLQWNYDPAGGGWWGRFTIPFSKWFFSPAYCLLAAGTGAILHAGLFAVIDVKGWTTAWALRVLGMNAIAVYVGAEFSFATIFSKWQVVLPTSGSDSLASGFLAWIESLTGSAVVAGWSLPVLWIAVWWLVSYRLWVRGIFIKV